MDDSKISSYTWDITEGCTKISAGCKNCYAERRLGAAFSTITLRHDRLNDPYKWSSRHVVLLNDTSDLFHDDVPLSFINQVMKVIADNTRHEFGILTKRPERIVRDGIELPHNTWFGISAENQEMLDARAPYLRMVNSRITYVSAQPLLGPLNLSDVKLDWIVVGAEYGPSYRPMDLDWVRDIRSQMQSRDIPMTFQQCINNNNERVVFPDLDGQKIQQFPR